MKRKVKVNEIFGPTIQGEGRTAGQNAIFIRLAHCNLACIWCDTPYTWNWKKHPAQHPEKYDRKKEVHLMTTEEIFQKIISLSTSIKRVVVTGGEPLIQQRKLVSIFRKFKENGYVIELETNGTLTPKPDILELIDQINCSPKLSNSGSDNSKSVRERPKTLKFLSSIPKCDFKFVVSRMKDIKEILRIINEYEINQDRIYLMPLGHTRKEHNKHKTATRRLCKKYGFNFSPRLQILRWGSIRAV